MLFNNLITSHIDFKAYLQIIFIPKILQHKLELKILLWYSLGLNY